MHDHLLRHYGPPSSALKAHCCDAAMGIGSLYVCAPVVARTQPTADTWYGTPKHENSATAYLHQCLNLSMDRTGAPKKLWLLCLLYCVYVLNRLAHATLNDRTPIEACFGVTPISVLSFASISSKKSTTMSAMNLMHLSRSSQTTKISLCWIVWLFARLMMIIPICELLLQVTRSLYKIRTKINVTNTSR